MGLFPPQVIVFKGGLLWSCHARRSSAEAALPQRLPHLHLGEAAALRQPHAGRCQAALGEDEEEEGGHRHPHQRQEEGQAQHRFVKALSDITLISYPISKWKIIIRICYSFFCHSVNLKVITIPNTLKKVQNI